MENIEVWEKVKFTFITISIICFKKGPKKYWIRVTVAATNAGPAFVAATIFPVVASLHPIYSFLGGEKQRPEIGLRSQAKATLKRDSIMQIPFQLMTSGQLRKKVVSSDPLSRL